VSARTRRISGDTLEQAKSIRQKPIQRRPGSRHAENFHDHPLAPPPIKLGIKHSLPRPEVELDCLGRAFDRAETILAAVLSKARFWDRFAAVEFNERQRAMVNRLLNGFEGKLTSSKWAKLAKCSHDTALRDIGNLIRKKVLVKDAAGGRSTSYSLVRFK
jgi:hypothetical protein